ncbi:GNAT family N-acetyltransferase [uncultured Modestobacter sp.]|uniref:GNAT family N-acetyltransferase n=1 Tax=uncultured Modestobacter sp. TaxID=380048 RepID=UPI00262D70C5|nr:GNAT family N-acetyltransferase [uncultured Modestobacter sp.]
MRTTVVAPSELGAAELATWRGFQRADPALDNPFLAPDFTIAVGEVRPRTRVAVLEEGGRIVGFLPFEPRGLGYGVAVAPGLSDCQGLVHAPGAEWSPRELLRSCGLAVWDFDHLLVGQQPFVPFHTLHVPSPVIDLSGGYDSWWAQRSAASSRLRDLDRRGRRLAREVGEVRFDFDARDPQALRALMRWKSAQYQRTGRTDRFAQGWVVELLDRLLDTRAEGCTGRLSVLRAGDELVAAHFGLSSGTVLPTWFPTYDPRFARSSPGLLLHRGMAGAAAAAGIPAIDMGPGHKDYKELLKTHDAVVAEGRVARPSAAAGLHWARRTPVRRLRHTVTTNPVLFRSADRVLKAYGRLSHAAPAGRAPAVNGAAPVSPTGPAAGRD